jgi:branched-chain amino acid transport system ATP-binding protein
VSSEEGTFVVSGLRAGYGTMEVVTGISLEVPPGEIVAIIGRNGAGKTTTLLALAGLRYGAVQSGTVTLGSVDLSRASANQMVNAGVAHVPEGHRIFSQLTVTENLRLGAYHRRREGRVVLSQTRDQVFELFPILGTYASRTAGLLSGGEQQMVAIGQALMAKPRVLMLDEPTSGLALAIIRTILEALTKLKNENLAILMVEQSVPRALSLSDSCYVMDRGQFVMSGASAELAKDQKVLDIVRGTSSHG